MLERLSIENLALIEQATLTLPGGLLAITGETGAGKSLLIHALELLSGVRVSRDLIRKGKEEAGVEAVFSACRQLLPETLKLELVEGGYVCQNLLPLSEEEEVLSIEQWPENLKRQVIEDFPDELVLSRSWQVRGKNLCRLNGRFLPLQKLKELAAHLIDIQAQRDQSLLYDEKVHLDFLDRYAGESLVEAKQAYLLCFEDLRDKVKRRKRLGGDPALRARTLDLLAYQIQEIEKVAPKAGEDEKLLIHLKRKTQHEKLYQLLYQTCTLLRGDEEQGGFLGQFDGANRQLQNFANGLQNPELKEIGERSESLLESLRTLLFDLEKEEERYLVEDDLLQRIQDRLNRLNQLKDKYGPQLADVLAFLEQSRAEKAQLESAEDELLSLDSALQVAQSDLLDRALKLSDLRREAAKRLEERVQKELQSLGMPNVRFVVEFKEMERLGRQGREAVSFLLQANLGEDLKPLSKIASGGESARILLAIKTILLKAQGLSLVFDEVDAGLSGEASSLVGKKLKTLAMDKQVFCVTHSAQIAAMASAQLCIRKESRDGRTLTELTTLDEQGRLHEIARLLSGDVQDGATLELARTLLARA